MRSNTETETRTENERAAGEYGCEQFGRLKKVMVHTPGDEMLMVNESNHNDLLFDRPPDVERFREEHLAYCGLLEQEGVEVVQLADHVKENSDLMSCLPNLTYMHDVAVITRMGAILSRMKWRARRGEEVVVREALGDIGVPVWIDFPRPDDVFEGCLLLSPQTVLVVQTERHTAASIDYFRGLVKEGFPEVLSVEIPGARRYMHPDTIFNRVDDGIALSFLPAFQRSVLYSNGRVQEIDFRRFMTERGVELIEVSDEEQQKLACTFVPLEPGVMLHYDTALSQRTVRMLERRGVEIKFFHPDAMTAGGGSLRCLTLRLLRDRDDLLRRY